MSLYVFYTWLMATIIFPFVIALWIPKDAVWVFLAYISMGVPYVMLWMIPCMLLSRFLIVKAVTLKIEWQVKFFVWLLLAGVSVLVSGILLALVLLVIGYTSHLGDLNDLFLAVWQMILSVWIASIIRYGYFSKLVKPKAE